MRPSTGCADKYSKPTRECFAFHSPPQVSIVKKLSAFINGNYFPLQYIASVPEQVLFIVPHRIAEIHGLRLAKHGA